MDKIKIAVLDATGYAQYEMEIDWSADQLDRFLSSSRIVVFSNDEPVHFVSDKHRWNPNTEKDD